MVLHYEFIYQLYNPECVSTTNNKNQTIIYYDNFIEWIFSIYTYSIKLSHISKIVDFIKKLEEINYLDTDILTDSIIITLYYKINKLILSSFSF